MVKNQPKITLKPPTGTRAKSAAENSYYSCFNYYCLSYYCLVLLLLVCRLPYTVRPHTVNHTTVSRIPSTVVRLSVYGKWGLVRMAYLCGFQDFNIF